MENKTSTNHENSNDANRLLCEVLSCVSKKAETPKEKYNQLKKDFENLTTDAEKMMQITIKHALKQSALVGGYSGFSKDFWNTNVSLAHNVPIICVRWGVTPPQFN